ncbi:MAG: PKD domain-containing protein, partial [Meiothermus sp.]|uniref:PKD domain-containing protein n=1 Tax=Meiothermus sp. TaxID=1955249 RepID=UPI0028CD214B
MQLGVPTTPQGVTPQIQLEAPITFAGGGFNFDAYGSGPPGSTYAWNFGDGTTGQGEAVYKTYSQPGYYDVTLTVTVPTGVSSSQTVRVAVLPEIHRIPATRATTGDSITFDVQYPLPGYTYRHSFSDGTSLEGPRVSKTFSNLGFYDYTLTILENGSIPPQSMGSRATAQNAGPRVVAVQRSRVNVWKPRPVARLTANVLAGNAPLTVGFSALSSTGSTPLAYSWDFGDGTTSTLAQPSKTYTSQGRYLVSLTVTDQKGQSDTEQTFIIVRDPGVNIILNVNYPAATGQSLSDLSEPGSDYTPRRAEAGRTPATGEVRAQNTSEYLDFFPYAFPSQNAQLRASIRGYNNTKLIRPGVIARWNGFEEAPGFSWDLFCPIDPDICDVAFFNPGYFVPILNANLFTFINVSQVFQIEYNIFRGLRVPRVMVSVLPDEQLPGDLASPFVRENTVEVGGRTELFLQVYVRASEAQSGLVSFEVPVYAVNNAGQRLANINGIFKARFKNVQSEPGDGVMVAGKSSIRVTVPIASYANAQNRFDLTQIEVYANPACGPDTTYSTTLRSHLNGCAQVTASHEAPGNNAAIQAYPYRLPADFQDRINRIFVGATPEARQAYDNNLKDLPGSVARFVIGFIPILGDTIDLVEQAYNAAVGNNVDPVLTTLAAAGLGLDLISGGAGDLTAIFKGVYRLSLETGGLLAQAIRAQLTGVINGSISARQFVDNLGARFARVTELGRTPQCGLLGLECIGKYDGLAAKYASQNNLSPEAALSRIDQNLERPNYKATNSTQRARLDDLAELANPTCSVGQFVTPQARVAPRNILCASRRVTDTVTVGSNAVERIKEVEFTIDPTKFNGGTAPSKAARDFRDTYGAYDSDGKLLDDAGHLIPYVFGGRGTSDNIVPVLATVNQGPISRFERVLKAQAAVSSVKVKIVLAYDDAATDPRKRLRPTQLTYFYEINGSTTPLPGLANPVVFDNT